MRKMARVEGVHILQAAPERELSDVQGLSTFQEVRQVEIADIVADDNIRICSNDKIPPSLQAKRCGQQHSVGVPYSGAASCLVPQQIEL